MNERDELASKIVGIGIGRTHINHGDALGIADKLIDAGYRKYRVITTFAELEALPFGSAVQTSDPSDVVVLRCEGNDFRNQSGCNLTATDLWRYGTRPFTVLYVPEES